MHALWLPGRSIGDETPRAGRSKLCTDAVGRPALEGLHRRSKLIGYRDDTRDDPSGDESEAYVRWMVASGDRSLSRRDESEAFAPGCTAFGSENPYIPIVSERISLEPPMTWIRP